MHKVKIMDVNQEEQSVDKKFKNQKNRKNSEKIIKIKDSLFEIAVRKGLIEKNEDGYYFNGDYKEFLALINKSSMKSLNF
jgi:hypothetical protein